jgi:hypothetical protein
VDQNQRGIVSGDLVIIPVNNTNISRTLPATTGRMEQVNFPQFLLATMSPETGAGFYSSIWGPLPWALPESHRSVISFFGSSSTVGYYEPSHEYAIVARAPRALPPRGRRRYVFLPQSFKRQIIA